MKTAISFLFILFSALTLLGQPRTPAPQPASAPAPVFGWDQEEKDFGTINMGVPVKAEFTFRNTGKAPLVIKDVRKSCGCTTVSFPREPILPGRSGTISAEYDASDPGVFNKKLTVLANTAEGMHTLTIKGNVK
ncbi:MAG TPA: DUF1573 domain-containing protein [Bacteroidales bacterium]|nr:DUF1573 domain-containing protein [Bacteroidales bacterium]HRZ77768.1 DUF1573 domain-containing protein [Bacteroidales bacterium]